MTIRFQIRTIMLMLLVFVAMPANADWVNDWFDKTVINSSGSYQNQQRGFYSAPGFSGRFNATTDYPITITKPKLSGGCGGIDLFLGGMSFLDADYMVEKLQRMMQVAPAVAFDMAMKTMCKECSETLVKLDAATNWLNGLQMNECAMSKRMVATVSKGDPNIVGSIWNEISSDTSLNESMNRSWQEAQEKMRESNNDPYVDLKKKVTGCPAEIKKIFEPGSIVAHAAEKAGMSEYANIIRGYIGDVTIHSGKDDKIPVAQKIQSCPLNEKTSLEDMLYGKAYAKREDGTCYLDSQKGVMDIVRGKLNQIAQKMKAQQVLTQDQINFINATPYVPVYSILKKAIIKDNVDMQIDMMTEIVSISYTWYIFNDLYRNTDNLFTSVQSSFESPGLSSGNKQCDLRVYAQATTQFDELHKSLIGNKSKILDAYVQKLNHLVTAFQYQQMHEADDKQMKAREALDYGT